MALRELNIRNFAIIKNLEIEIDDGLTIITGETGAGKSILLDALNLVLGARAESDMIRHGESQCEISALFSIEKLKAVQQWLQEHDYDGGNYCLIRRVVRDNRPTKCYINDQSATLNSLKQLGLLLVDLHGQHEHQSLLRKPNQRQIIDEFAQHDKELEKMSAVAKKVNDLQQRINQQLQNQADYSGRIELLEFQLSELDEASILDNEFEQLETEESRLSNAQQLISGIEHSIDSLYNNEASASNSENISSQLGSVTHQLDQLSEYEPSIKPANELLNSALAQIDEAKYSLQSSLSHIDIDPELLYEVQQRIDTIIQLARKHRCTEAQLPEYHQRLSDEFKNLQTQQQQPEQLQAELTELRQNYFSLAKKVSQKRQKMAEKLSLDISAQMQDLGMQGGKLSIQVAPNLEENITHFSEHGIDQIEYLVSTNQGMPLKTLQKTASGGELSRISLAIQVITSERSNTPSLVFDEVDVGVGGSVAEIVGNRLRSLGNNAQVLCITHLPQVAAQGHQHLFVDKAVENDETFSLIRKLDTERRTEEIARMLGGTQITERTRAHAAEMLKLD